MHQQTQDARLAWDPWLLVFAECLYRIVATRRQIVSCHMLKVILWWTKLSYAQVPGSLR
jgi:hypothetical protein